jgi:L-seryl-tRNA(Ser) seleniumtransferase
MLRLSREALLARARPFLECGAPRITFVQGHSLLGGGSTPDQVIPSPLLAVEGDEVRMERRLRQGEPPVVARIEAGRLLIDLRTVDPNDDGLLLQALQAAATSR